MPRYYFQISDRRQAVIGNDGIELPDREAAWTEATGACGEILRNLDGRLRPGDEWKMRVKDAEGGDVFELEFRTRQF